MKDITGYVNMYRECIRNLWNVHFLRIASKQVNWDVQDEFEKICVMLFSLLVLDPLGLDANKKSYSYEKCPKPLLPLCVIPITTKISININREKECCGYWDYPVHSIDPGDVDLRFIDLFDFDQMGFRDFEYYRVRIVDSAVSKELIGRDALVRCSYAKLLMKIYSDEKNEKCENGIRP